ncbi:hypothetical protein MTP99_011034 [Tenebrio molitor]|nr:hypothetical protein MTP99_011034 [Tenebrio molitor]
MSGPASGSGQVTATSAVAAARGTTLAWWTGEPPTPRIWRTGGSTKIKFALDAGDGRARKGWKIYTRKSPSRCSPGLSCRTHRFNGPHEIPIFTDFQPDNYTSAAKQSHIFTSDQIGVCMQ